MSRKPFRSPVILTSEVVVTDGLKILLVHKDISGGGHICSFPETDRGDSETAEHTAVRALLTQTGVNPDIRKLQLIKVWSAEGRDVRPPDPRSRLASVFLLQQRPPTFDEIGGEERYTVEVTTIYDQRLNALLAPERLEIIEDLRAGKYS